MPFVAEEIYQNVDIEKESVHLEDWAKVEKKFVDEKIVTEMEKVLAIVEKGLAARAEAGIKVRQPLARYTTSLTKKLDAGLIELVTDELNVKALGFNSNDVLDTTISDELRVEGVFRELVRQINQMRKDQGMTIKDRIAIYYQGLDEVFMKFGDELKKQTLADSIISDTVDNMKTIDGGSVGIEKANS
jgi:isoleucyl-tRNA synthetase